MKKPALALSLLLAVATGALGQAKEPAPAAPRPPPARPEPPEFFANNRVQARECSDAMVKALIEGKHGDLRQKMARAFQDAYAEEVMAPMLEKLFAAYGKPLAADFKMDELGYKVMGNGKKLPMRKFWYAAQTTKHEKGTHFIFTEIVPDGAGVAGVTFSIVAFPLGTPSNLK